jgi:hypothetical protein
MPNNRQQMTSQMLPPQAPVITGPPNGRTRPSQSPNLTHAQPHTPTPIPATSKNSRKGNTEKPKKVKANFL